MVNPYSTPFAILPQPKVARGYGCRLDGLINCKMIDSPALAKNKPNVNITDFALACQMQQVGAVHLLLHCDILAVLIIRWHCDPFTHNSVPRHLGITLEASDLALLQLHLELVTDELMLPH